MEKKTASKKPATKLTNKNMPGTETRNKDWKTLVTQFNTTHFVFEEDFNVQQELLQDLAPNLEKQWGIDIAKLTKSSRAAFERISQKVQEKLD